MKSSISSRFNADLLEQKYDAWSNDPESVDSEWRAFFEGFELGTTQLNNRQSEAARSPAVGITSEVSSEDEHYLNFRGKVVSLV